jgi:hypothetical protein
MKKIVIFVLGLLFITGCETNPDHYSKIQSVDGVKIEFIGTVNGSELYKITMTDSTVVLLSSNNGNYGHESMTKIK